jgi:hypothetical protein
MEYNEETGEVESMKVHFLDLDPNYEYHVQWCDVMVWRFKNAPYWAKYLSINGGDEDWLAICTVKFWNQQNHYIPWIDRMGVCDVDVFEVDEKFMVFIGSHA